MDCSDFPMGINKVELIIDSVKKGFMFHISDPVSVMMSDNILITDLIMPECDI